MVQRKRVGAGGGSVPREARTLLIAVRSKCNLKRYFAHYEYIIRRTKGGKGGGGGGGGGACVPGAPPPPPPPPPGSATV